MTEPSRNPNGKVRLTDIAETANVSIATVSRVLNGKEGVSDTARDKVLEALDLLGYMRPQILIPQPQGLIGIVIPELTNPIFGEFATQLTVTLSRHGYNSLLCSQSPGGATEDECINILLQSGVRGIIFVSGLHADTTLPHDRYRALINSGVTLALINGYAPDIDALSFATDDAAAIVQSVFHLRQLGHTDIALLIGQRRFVPTQRKIKAFCSALATPDPERHVIDSLFTIEGGHSAAVRAIQTGHTALICGSDLMAVGAIRGARSLGLRVPEDVSVIGYDDSKLAVFFDPPLTTVHQPVGLIVDMVAETLIQEIEGSPRPHTEFLFRPEVIVRQSTGVGPQA